VTAKQFPAIGLKGWVWKSQSSHACPGSHQVGGKPAEAAGDPLSIYLQRRWDPEPFTTEPVWSVHWATWVLKVTLVLLSLEK